MSGAQAGKTKGWVQAGLSARALTLGLYMWLGLPHSVETSGYLGFLHGGTGL